MRNGGDKPWKPQQRKFDIEVAFIPTAPPSFLNAFLRDIHFNNNFLQTLAAFSF
jgi:hypothetical protein